MKKYNGWANYETWLLSCSLLNDETLNEQAKQINDVEELKEFMTDYVHKVPNGIALQLLHNFVCAVDWRELYEAVKQEA